MHTVRDWTPMISGSMFRILANGSVIPSLNLSRSNLFNASANYPTSIKMFFRKHTFERGALGSHGLRVGLFLPSVFGLSLKNVPVFGFWISYRSRVVSFFLGQVSGIGIKMCRFSGFRRYAVS